MLLLLLLLVLAQVIQRKRKEYLDPQSRNNMARLNDDLADIHNIMKQNIEEVLNRGEKLDRKCLQPGVPVLLLLLLLSVVLLLCRSWRPSFLGVCEASPGCFTAPYRPK